MQTSSISFFWHYKNQVHAFFRFLLSCFTLSFGLTHVYVSYSFLVIVMPWIILVVDVDPFLVESVVVTVSWKPVVIELCKDGYLWNQFSLIHKSLFNYECRKDACCWRWLQHTLHQLWLVPCNLLCFSRRNVFQSLKPACHFPSMIMCVYIWIAQKLICSLGTWIVPHRWGI